MEGIIGKFCRGLYYCSAYGVGSLASCGLTQTLAVPGIVITGIAVGILKYQEHKYISGAEEFADGIGTPKGSYLAKAEKYKYRTEKAIATIKFFRLGTIPVLGLFIGAYHLDMDLRDKKDAHIFRLQALENLDT